MEGAIFSSIVDPTMRGIVLLLICMVLLSAGCIQKEGGSKNTSAAGMSPLSVAITSLKAGEIFSGDKDVKFDSEVKGGKEPYAYKWTSNIDGVISNSKSFTEKTSKMGKGEHTIILMVADASGSSAEGSVQIWVM